MARRSTRVFTRPAPRTKMWIGSGLAVAQPAASAATLFATYSAAALLLRPFTILRTRLDINWRSDQTAASEAPTGAYGEIIVKESATDIGVTAVPHPLADTEADWYIYQGLTAPFLFITGVGIAGRAGFRYVVDSKAMRKVGPQDDLAAVIELRAAGGGLINVEGRQLIQLH